MHTIRIQKLIRTIQILMSNVTLILVTAINDDGFGEFKSRIVLTFQWVSLRSSLAVYGCVLFVLNEFAAVSLLLLLLFLSLFTLYALHSA